MLEGSLVVKMHGRTHVVDAGEAIEIPPGTPHTQRPGGDGPGRVRITVTPSGRMDELLDRFRELSETKQINRFGYPRHVLRTIA